MSGPSSVAVKGRRRVFQNSRFNVFADHIAAGALEVPDFLVVAPHSTRSDFMTGVVVVPVRDDSVLLLKCYRHPISQHIWELPRGFVDAGEEPSAAALRELAEETGLDCRPEQLMDMGTFFPDPGIIRARVALFAATGCRPCGGRVDDEIGIEDAIWYSRRQVRDLLRQGVVQDGASCVALHRYYAALEDGRVG